MKNLSLGLLFSLVFTSLLHAIPAGAVSIPFTTSRVQFVDGDSITIQEVLATSAALGPGDTVVVRGQYTLQSSAEAILGLSLTTAASGPTSVAPAARKKVSAGSGTFELEYAIRDTGSLHVSFSPTGSGSSFGNIYFAAASGGGTTPPPPPTTSTTSISVNGLVDVPFATSNARFDAGDSLTIRQVLASSSQLLPGDRVVVRGEYRLQSRPQALLLFTLTANAPGAVESIAANSRRQIDAGSGTFELEYTIAQPGALHVSLYSQPSGSAFGGVYFAPPGAANQSSPALLQPAANTGVFANLSTRGLVGAGDSALVSGLNVTGRERYVLIRAVGPTLGTFGVTNVLRRPAVSVYDAAGNVIATGRSWATGFSADQRNALDMLARSVGAFPLAAGSEDAVLHLRLMPGSYTIGVTPADGQTGVALLEVYASDTFTLPMAQ